MRLSADEFRDHMNSMVSKKQYKQAAIWAESGTLIYANVDELREIYDEEYRDLVDN